MIGKFLVVLNFNRLFLKLNRSFVTSCRFSPTIGHSPEVSMNFHPMMSGMNRRFRVRWTDWLSLRKKLVEEVQDYGIYLKMKWMKAAKPEDVPKN